MRIDEDKIKEQMVEAVKAVFGDLDPKMVEPEWCGEMFLALAIPGGELALFYWNPNRLPSWKRDGLLWNVGDACGPTDWGATAMEACLATKARLEG